ERLLNTRERVLGDDHIDTLQSMTDLESTYYLLGQWTEAEELQLQVLETRKNILGAQHPETLKSMDSLAQMYREQRRLSDAEELQT
ncbi:hypothetical protein QQS21_012403, partial [Conoideocrella luteorostrata]